MIARGHAADDLLCNRQSNQSDVCSYHWNTNCRQSCQHVSPYISAIFPNASKSRLTIPFDINLHLMQLLLHDFHFSVTDRFLFSYVVVVIRVVVVVVVVVVQQ